jgi:hypothetical protein
VLLRVSFEQVDIDDVEVLVDPFAGDGERLVFGFFRHLRPSRPDYRQHCRCDGTCTHQPQHVSA